jgi:hypothetical protein
MRKTRVYLDNCAYNRPFDDQSQIRISLREPFDYTAWQKEHYATISVHELNQKAIEYVKAHPFSPVASE